MFEERRLIRSMSIDDYVLRAATEMIGSRVSLADRYFEIFDALDNQNLDLAIVRYEDMVTCFDCWLDTVIGVIAPRLRPGSPVMPIDAESLRIAAEGPKNQAHRRKVTPGDHKEKLKSSTIETLDGVFRPVHQRFGYAN